jgi:hypothetical protein
MIRKLLLIGLILIVPTLGFAESRPKHPRARAAAKECEVARRERERREDLERRIQRLEQRYELTEPSMPPPDAPATSGHVR